MAARKTLQHSPLTRDRIRTGMLVKRLEMFALGELTGDKVVEMSPHAVSAALGLLKKVLPDLQSTTISGDADNPLHIKPDMSGLSDEQLRVIASIKLGD